jgi:hypothetical protein
MDCVHPDSALIDQLGSTSAVAALFEVRPQAVSQWRRNGIPRARRQTMALLRPDVFGQGGAADGDPDDAPPVATGEQPRQGQAQL